MSAADRELTSDETSPDASLPIGDLEGTSVEAAAADQVKGGDTASTRVHVSDILITKTTDKSSTAL